MYLEWHLLLLWFLWWSSPSYAVIKCHRKRTIFISSVWEMNFLNLFIWIWIKLHFPLKSPITNFLRSLFYLARETYLSWEKENRQKSYIYIYIFKKRGPRIEPWETSEFMASPKELWPYNSNLNRRNPSCHSLSNALDTFRNTLLTSIVG